MNASAELVSLARNVNNLSTNVRPIRVLTMQSAWKAILDISVNVPKERLVRLQARLVTLRQTRMVSLYVMAVTPS